MIYQIEYHRVWLKTVEADNREQARQIAEEEMGEESDAEDYNYAVVKRGDVKPSGKGKGKGR